MRDGAPRGGLRTETGATSPQPEGSTLRRWPTLPLVLILLGAMVPLTRAVRIVTGSSRSQYNDYWPMIDGLLAGDGSLRIAGFFEFRNEHPIFVPRLAYWANAQLFGGDNHTLGFFVVAVVAAQVAVVAVLARSTRGLGTWPRVSLVITATALLFTPFGAWNFVKAMSGTAWLVANLFVLAALLAQRLDRRFLAPALALLATWSYGTGLAAWPALLVALAALTSAGRAPWRRNWPTLVAGTGAAVWYVGWLRSSGSSSVVERSLLDSARLFVERLGWPLAGPELAFEVGVACLVLLSVGVVLVARDRSKRAAAAPWLGLAAYALTSCALIVASRPDQFLTGMAVSRYTSLGVLAWLSVTALLLVALSGRRWSALLPIPLVAASWLGGGWVVEAMEPSTHQHDLLAVAIRLDLADGNRIASPQPFPALTERLRLSGHYPFDGRYDLDCGDMGEVAKLVPSELVGSWREDDGRAPGGTFLRGSAGPVQDDLACVVVLDEDDRVVGAGPWWHEDGALQFIVVAPDLEEPRVALRRPGESTYEVIDADPS